MAIEHVDIPDPQSDFIRRLVAAGRYESVDEVIRAGVVLLEERISREAEQKVQLGLLMDKAFASGVVEESFEEIWDDVESRYRKENA